MLYLGAFYMIRKTYYFMLQFLLQVLQEPQ